MQNKDEIQNLGLVKLGKEKLYLGLLPKNYQSVIVNYDYHISVSCVMPEETHLVQVKYMEEEDFDIYDHSLLETRYLKHRSPPLLFKLNYADFPSTRMIDGDLLAEVYAIDIKVKDRILGTAYTLPNVFTDGRICFGEVGNPADLRSVHNLFWCSPFNYLTDDMDLQGLKSNVEYIRRYKSWVLSKQKFEDLTTQICGTKFWSTTQSALGILITSNQALLKKIPQQYWLRNQNGPLLITLVNQIEDQWHCFSKKFNFQLEKDNLKTLYSQCAEVQKLIEKFQTTTSEANTSEAKKPQKTGLKV